VPVELSELLSDKRAAVVTMELQRGVVGDRSSFPELAKAVSDGKVIENSARLCAAAREHEIPVVHCTAGFLADRSGSPSNSPLISAMLRRPKHLLEGTDAVELVPELGSAPQDMVSHRRHGVSPFIGTDLDQILRARGVSTVVAVGVSVNLGIIGLSVEAVNLGYSVVIPTDAVAGVPADYSVQVLRHTLSLVARLSAVDDVVSALGNTERSSPA
jgi:nicotinamidase-related amidase